jgi:hypothetical protein
MKVASSRTVSLLICRESNDISSVSICTGSASEVILRVLD